MINLALSTEMPQSDQEGLVIYDDGDHRWVWLGGDAEIGAGVAANQYLVQNNGRGCLLDPGSVLDFARSVANISRFCASDDIDILFYSHQDPDVSSSAPMWAGITQAKLHMSALWTRFLPHFGDFDQERIVAIADNGGDMTLGRSHLRVIPAHFLHAPGNLVVYDPVSRFLFSGDIGANLPPASVPLFIDDFQAHLPHLEGFHQRYMASNAACQLFVKRLRGLQIDAVLPQHGSIYRGQAAQDFIAWLGSLRCGIDLMKA